MPQRRFGPLTPKAHGARLNAFVYSRIADMVKATRKYGIGDWVYVKKLKLVTQVTDIEWESMYVLKDADGYYGSRDLEPADAPKP